MTLIFFGSSDFSLHALRACLESSQRILKIITTPPQKKGRGLQESPTPVQIFAEKNKIPFMASASLKAPELLAEIQNLKPELFVVSSYGKIVPTSWLKVPTRYALNIHPSLLPKYRGAAPVNWPILLGDMETGISIAEVTPELDAGDIFYQRRIPIPPDADSQSMAEILGQASAAAIQEVFNSLAAGELPRTPQNHSLTSYARKLTKDDGRIDWQRNARQLANQIRGLVPWPMASFEFKGEAVQILKGKTERESSSSAKPGQILKVTPETLNVQSGEGILCLEKLKPAGKKEMSGGDFARGRRLKPGDLLA